MKISEMLEALSKAKEMVGDVEVTLLHRGNGGMSEDRYVGVEQVRPMIGYYSIPFGGVCVELR